MKDNIRHSLSLVHVPLSSTFCGKWVTLNFFPVYCFSQRKKTYSKHRRLPLKVFWPLRAAPTLAILGLSLFAKMVRKGISKFRKPNQSKMQDLAFLINLIFSDFVALVDFVEFQLFGSKFFCWISTLNLEFSMLSYLSPAKDPFFKKSAQLLKWLVFFSPCKKLRSSDTSQFLDQVCRAENWKRTLFFAKSSIWSRTIYVLALWLFR